MQFKKLSSIHAKNNICFPILAICSPIKSSEIYTPGYTYLQIVDNNLPINLVRPSIVYEPGFVFMFGGTVFETGKENTNVLMFNLTSLSWTILDFQVK
jgi:hypothetical protein